MKIRRVHIANFKRFGPPHGVSVDFRNQPLDEVAETFLVLGDNGSGKTTVLQAIALTLGLAARKITSIGDFWWKGWLPERFFAHEDPFVEVEVEFSEDEIVATQEAARRWWAVARLPGSFVSPGSSPRVTLQLQGAQVSALGGRAELYQLRGRAYAAMALAKVKDPKLHALFARLPGVFWYDQYRTVETPARDIEREEGADPPGFTVGVERVERILKAWYEQRSQGRRLPKELDFLAQLEERFAALFPGRSFAGLEPIYSGTSPTPDDNRFMLSDGRRTYALVEMSAGEQAIFPILFEFIRQRIGHSVVLIDELDLNLHPPLAQELLGALPHLGESNQFIFTTHSEAISTMVSPHEVHRLAGGNLCL